MVQREGYRHIEDADASSDYTVTRQNCNEVFADVAGIIKVDFRKGFDGETFTRVFALAAGIPIKLRNVIKVYQEYKASTNCTATIYNSAGATKVGLHLCFYDA